MSTRDTLGTGARCGGDGVPDEGVGRVQIRRLRRRRREALQRLGDAGGKLDQALVHQQGSDWLDGEG